MSPKLTSCAPSRKNDPQRMIHPTAIVHPGAELGADVEIGAADLIVLTQVNVTVNRPTAGRGGLR